MAKTRDRLYLYAVVDGSEPLSAPLAGLGGAPVELLPRREVAAIVSSVDLVDLRDTAAAALIHEQVIEALMGTRRTLPVRFGTVFSNADTLYAAMDDRYAVLCEDLGRLAGQVEIGVRVLWDIEERRAAATRVQAEEATAPGDEGPGMRYLRERMREVAAREWLRQEAAELERTCRQRLEPYVSAMTTSVLVTEGIPVSAACLVPRTAVDRFVAAVTHLQQGDRTMQFICTGPWPPYHFVTDSKGERP